MSGRGLPGGGLVRHHKPGDIKVTLNLRTTISSPTVSLPQSDTDASALPDTYIQIYASVKHSTHPELPVTLSTWRTPLERARAPNDFSPIWFNSGLSYFHSTSNSDRYGGPPELSYRVGQRGGFARNLREDWDFVTIPSSASGKELVVKHRVPVETLRFSQKKDDGYRKDVKPEQGERWLIGPSEGGLGTFWWRWGDIEGDLKGLEFRNDEWYDGDKTEGEKSKNKETDKEWIESEGDNGFGLTMQIENQAEVIFV